MPTLPELPSPRHPELPEIRRRAVAKADLRKADIWRPQIGRALQRAVSLCGWSLKEFAAAVDRDPRQCARWINGSEPPSLAAIFAVESLRQPFVQALGELAGADVSVVITIRKSA